MNIRPEHIKLTERQIKAIAALWDATDEFAQTTPYWDRDWQEQQTALIAAREEMCRCFPPDHPVQTRMLI
jgi:hypothetical protein